MDRSEYASYDGMGLAELVRDKDVTPAELVELAVEQIEAFNGQLNAVVHKAYDSARADAKAGPSGPFAGVPFLIKDFTLRVKGMPRTDGSNFSSPEPDTEDDLLTERFRDAGLVLLGKTNTPEYGITGTTESRRLGPCRNPWNTDHITGGSSGGAAGAVASGIVPMAHGGDGLGSIRIPAACCGLVGLKPTRGRVPIGPHQDGEVTVGYIVNHVLTRTVRDCAAMLDVVGKPDPTDPMDQPRDGGGGFLQSVSEAPGRLRIAFSDETPNGKQIEPGIKESLVRIAKSLEDLGHHVEEKGLGIDYRPMYAASAAVMGAHSAGAMLERIEQLGREPGLDDIEPLTMRNWRAVQKVTAPQVGRARRTLATISRQILSFFEGVDIYLTPVLGTSVPKIGTIDPVHMDPKDVDKAQARAFPFTPPFNVSGQPGISLPLAEDQNGLPVGLMFHSRFGDEKTLFRLASQLEQAIPWQDRRPKVWAA